MKECFALLLILVLAFSSCKDDKSTCETYNEAYVDVTNNSASTWYLKWPADTNISMGDIPSGQTHSFKFNASGGSGNVLFIFKEVGGPGRIEKQAAILECQRQALSIP